MHEAFVIEIFAGTGGITAWLRKVGMTSSFGIDCMKFKHPKAPIVVLDLLSPEGERLLWQYLANPRVIGVWLAPPCGTSSKAREIDNGGPAPLRSDMEPDGFKNLSYANQQRIDKANALYALTTRVINFCCKEGLFFFLENPFSSVYWKTSAFRSIEQLDNLFFQSHVACAYGSRRPKKTMLVSNIPEVEMVCHPCPGNHQHLKWGQVTINNKQVFATSTEKHYPAGLCAYIAKVVMHVCENYKLQLPMDSLQTMRSDLTTILSMARAQTSQFSRTKLPQLVAEYKYIEKVVHLEPNIEVGKSCMSPATVPMLNGASFHIPRDARLLTKLHHERGGEQNDENFVCCTWGIQWSEHEFIEAAVNLGHPKSFLKTLPNELEHVVEQISWLADPDLMQLRINWLKKWIDRADAIKTTEVDLHESFDFSTRRVISGKRIKLFKEMLEDAGYHDLGVCDILLHGVPMVGEVQESGHFPKTFRPALISTTLLEERSEDINAAVLAKTRSSGDHECENFVYAETLKEVDRGWLEGPIALKDLESGSSISRRFGLWQKTKYRCIDDFSASLVNATCSISESPFLHTVDISCALLDRWMRNNAANDTEVNIVGRSFDLKAAYRQLCIKPEHRKHAHISVYNPSTGCAEIFKGVAMPFGSVQSVYNFLRMSHAIWFLGTTKLLLPWTFFYDDFLCFSKDSLARHTEECVLLFFKLIGWRIAEEGAKAESFNTTFNCLGVTFDLSKSVAAQVFVANTSGRVDELTKEVNTILETCRLKKSAANKLRGRMQFAENQIFGRLNRRCLKAIAEHATIADERISFQMNILLKEFLESLSANRPRCVNAKSCQTWFIFTDAFYEQEAQPCAGTGGVLISPMGQILEFFSEALHDDLAVSLGHGTKGTIIFEAELLAVWIAVKTWCKFFANSLLVIYVDNDSVRGAYAASTHRAGATGRLLERLNRTEENLQVDVWIARVPTKCNIADKPSRFDITELLNIGAKRVSCNLNLDALR